ncbi:MAG: type II toxin-antitoxin system HigB family toxin [Blastocatellia bacterium]
MFDAGRGEGLFDAERIAGNRYRLIAIIRYDLEQVDIEAILTYAEYDRDKWKKNC